MYKTLLSVVLGALLPVSFQTASFAGPSGARDSSPVAAASNEDASNTSNKGAKLVKKILDQLWDEVEKALDNNDNETAISKLNEILVLEQNSTEAKALLKRLGGSIPPELAPESSSNAAPTQKLTQLPAKWEPGNEAGERKVVMVNGAEFAFRWCPAGKFDFSYFNIGSRYGSEGIRPDTSTSCTETLAQGFWIMETEVTQRQWNAVMSSNPSFFQGDNYPVERVSWSDCHLFCQKCNVLGLPVKLPSVIQWEYACISPTKKPDKKSEDEEIEDEEEEEEVEDKAETDEGIRELEVYWSRTYVYSEPKRANEKKWYSNNSDGMTHPVGTKTPNEWGLYDMVGNVSEWCEDWHKIHILKMGSLRDMNYHIHCGGDYVSNIYYSGPCTHSFSPDVPSQHIGFRCVIAQ